MRICSVEGCDKASRANTFCNMHNQRMRYTGTTDPGPKSHAHVDNRFWRKVVKADGCWLWTGSKTKQGYGRLQAGGKGSATISAHRLSYEIHHGDIPDGLVVMHKCDCPSCVNPDHLTVGTHKDNTADMIRKGRQVIAPALGEANPRSKLTADMVRYIRANPHRGHKDLADEFGLSPNAVRGVRIGRTWTHIE